MMNNTDMMKKVFINREMKKDFGVTVEDYTNYRESDPTATDGVYRKRKNNVPNNRWNEWKKVNDLIGKFNALRSAPVNVKATDTGKAVLNALAAVPDAEALTIKIADLNKDKEDLKNSLRIERDRADELEKKVRRLDSLNESLQADKKALLGTVELAVSEDNSAELLALYQAILGVLPAVAIEDLGKGFIESLLQHRIGNLSK